MLTLYRIWIAVTKMKDICCFNKMDPPGVPTIFITVSTHVSYTFIKHLVFAK